MGLDVQGKGPQAGGQQLQKLPVGGQSLGRGQVEQTGGGGCLLLWDKPGVLGLIRIGGDGPGCAELMFLCIPHRSAAENVGKNLPALCWKQFPG